MSHIDFVRLWDAFDRATDPHATPLMRAKQKRILLVVARRLCPQLTGIIGRTIDKVNLFEDAQYQAHWARWDLYQVLLNEIKEEVE